MSKEAGGASENGRDEDVPRLVWNQATAMERHLLTEQARTNRWLSEVVDILRQVREQTTKTNGRVTGLEDREKATQAERLESHEVLAIVKRWRLWAVWALGLMSAGIGTVLTMVLQAWVAKHF